MKPDLTYFQDERHGIVYYWPESQEAKEYLSEYAPSGLHGLESAYPFPSTFGLFPFYIEERREFLPKEIKALRENGMTSSVSVSFPIRGAKFRPPAAALLSILPTGAKLVLVSDPLGVTVGTKHDDPNAIAVQLPISTLYELEPDSFATIRNEEGFKLAELELLERNQPIHLGYVPKEIAAQLQLTGDVPAAFGTSADGSPRVCFEVEVED